MLFTAGVVLAITALVVYGALTFDDYVKDVTVDERSDLPRFRFRISFMACASTIATTAMLLRVLGVVQRPSRGVCVVFALLVGMGAIWVNVDSASLKA
jgi:hypothetical protein